MLQPFHTYRYCAVSLWIFPCLRIHLREYCLFRSSNISYFHLFPGSILQFIRFLRRTEGVEAARKYFMDARKSPSCTYHVYVAYAMMAFCLDKDAKVTGDMYYILSLRSFIYLNITLKFYTDRLDFIFLGPRSPLFVTYC